MSNNLRVQNRDSLEGDISRVTMQLTYKELQSRLQDARIAYGALNQPSDLKGHDAFRAVNYFNSDGKKLELAAHPVKWADSNQNKLGRAPKIGEHTKEITKEFGI